MVCIEIQQANAVLAVLEKELNINWSACFLVSGGDDSVLIRAHGKHLIRRYDIDRHGNVVRSDEYYEDEGDL